MLRRSRTVHRPQRKCRGAVRRGESRRDYLAVGSAERLFILTAVAAVQVYARRAGRQAPARVCCGRAPKARALPSRHRPTSCAHSFPTRRQARPGVRSPHSPRLSVPASSSNRPSGGRCWPRQRTRTSTSFGAHMSAPLHRKSRHAVTASSPWL